MTPPMLPVTSAEDQNQIMLAPEEAAHKGPPVRLRKFLAVLIKWWWIPIVTVSVSYGATRAFVKRLPPNFVSSARMWETEKVRLPEGELFSEDMATFVGSQTELLQSGKLRELTLERMRASDPKVVATGSDGQPLPVTIRVWQAAKSSVFVLEATSSQGAYVQTYLNTLMDVYLDYRKQVRKLVSGDTLESITEQVKKWERDLRTEQDILTAFQKTNNMSILQEEGTVSGGYLARLQGQLSDLQLEDRLLNATNAIGPIGAFGASSGRNSALDNAGSSTSLKSSSGDEAATQELALLRMQRDKLSKYLRPKHPKIVKLDADIERARTVADMFREENQKRLEQTRQEVRLRIENMIPVIAEWQAKVITANGLIAEAERLKQNVQRVQSVYDRLVSLVQNVGISREIDQENIAILEQASPAVRTFSQEKSDLMQSGVGGLGLGLAIIFLIALRDDRFTSVRDVNEKFGNSIVGQVPEVSGCKRNALLPLLENNDRRHAYAEAYRSLRSALLFVPQGGDAPRLVLITSAMPNEGKSTIAANLSRALALGGSRVVLVDADMRRGTLDRLMGVQGGAGLAELLQGSEPLERVIRTDSLPNLSFISRGGHCTHPGDLFLTPAFGDMLARLRKQFDYVLIDSSPVFAADDVTTLAPKMDGTLLVVRRGFSSARAVSEAIELLAQRRARILGLIFNRANASARSYYYYNHAEYFPTRAAG